MNLNIIITVIVAGLLLPGVLAGVALAETPTPNETVANGTETATPLPTDTPTPECSEDDGISEYRTCLRDSTTKEQLLSISEQDPSTLTQKEIDRVYAVYPARADEMGLTDAQEAQITDWMTWQKTGIAPNDSTPTSTPDDTSDGSPVSAPTNVSFDFSGVGDAIDSVADRIWGDDEPLDRGVIRYEEAEGEGYSTRYDWGTTRFVDRTFEPATDTAVFAFYVTGDDDMVAITESVEGSVEARQTRADLDQGPGIYWVRADVVHKDGIFGGEQCASLATREGSHNLRNSCQETGIGPLIPDAPGLLSMFIGSVSVAVGTLAVAHIWGGRRARRVKNL